MGLKNKKVFGLFLYSSDDRRIFAVFSTRPQAVQAWRRWKARDTHAASLAGHPTTPADKYGDAPDIEVIPLDPLPPFKP